MLTVQFHNDGTGTEEIGNYDYTAYVNDICVARGRLENYHRYHGWIGLVKYFIETVEKKESEKIDIIIKTLMEG